MTRFRRPVKGRRLLRAPELRLRHPRQGRTIDRQCYDEGVGVGFDDASPDAYAERWSRVDAGADEVLRWYVERFAELGWTPVSDIPTTGLATIALTREPDERAGVLVQALDDWYGRPDRGVNRTAGPNGLRVHLAVAGTFPDGRTGPRLG